MEWVVEELHLSSVLPTSISKVQDIEAFDTCVSFNSLKIQPPKIVTGIDAE